MRCKSCKRGSIVAVDLMPRIIAMAGTVEEPDFDPENLDRDDYEASVTVGYGCLTSSCENWYGSIGSVTLDYEPSKTYRISGQNELTDVAEDGEPEED